ncbi:MAG: type I glyceraldehyde-3-phosphate dehydrogenase [Bacteriovoracaceae bacterium]|nr:type I glyceraldehyde-3-phosphate dehydrogenase [Bacteriovoracaceae bacterium]
MANLKVGINGMGRIGRQVLKAILNNKSANIDVVAVNDLADINQIAHLFKYDSVHGRYQGTVQADGDSLYIDSKDIKYYGIKDPSEIPWDTHNIDLVIDGTGIFKDKAGLGRHMKGSVKKVIMCAPGKDLDGTFVMGVNDETYDSSKHHIVSNASCTTNCLAPIAKIIHDNWGIQNGMMTTTHAYTQDQRLLDSMHSDPRRMRSAALSMIPTTTGAAKAVGLVIPELKGKLDGFAIRVPTPNVSVVDLTVNLKKPATLEEVKKALSDAANGRLKGVLGYTEKKLVSIDFCGTTESSTVDGTLTNIIDGTTLKVVSWYDNEVGFSNRVMDLARLMGDKL